MKLEWMLQRIPVLAAQDVENVEITGITCDSRKVQPGFLFVAVSGSQDRGSRYIRDALSRGAAAVVTQEICAESIPWVQTRDTRSALAALSACFYGDPAKKLILGAVTGTNGKSSVTWFLKQLLEKATGKKVGLLGTVEYDLGGRVMPAQRTTPGSDELQALLGEMADNGCQYGLLEASSHALDQKRLEGLSFAVGGFTNLSRDHLDYHGSMEAYCQAKGKLFSMCQRAVVNADDPWCHRILQFTPAETLRISTEGNADLWAEDIELHADRTAFTACCGLHRKRITLPIPGNFTVQNGLMALGLALQLGLVFSDACDGLQGTAGIKGRMEPVRLPGLAPAVILDYAHTPDGMEKVLGSLRPFCKGRLICLFGCGGDRDRGKRATMGAIAARLSDIVIVTSDNPRHEDPKAILADILQGMAGVKNKKVFENRAQALRYAIDIGKKDDIIVLLGKGHETSQQIGDRFFPFDERKLLQSILAQKR